MLESSNSKSALTDNTITAAVLPRTQMDTLAADTISTVHGPMDAYSAIVSTEDRDSRILGKRRRDTDGKFF
jgi:hypothetical protein